jgi:hypothetical protein
MQTYQLLTKNRPTHPRDRQQARRIARTCSEQVQ